jgi:hypothetical protein
MDMAWEWFLFWNVLVYFVSFVPHSFFEWISHRFFLHSPVILRFPYEEHDRTHHVIHREDETFHLPPGSPPYRIDFQARDFAIFLGTIMPIWFGVEFLIQKPILIGAFVSAMTWLCMFNFIHRRFHEPKDTWFERTRYFQYLKAHHRLHHADSSRNLNVAFPPFADLVLRTLKR